MDFWLRYTTISEPLGFLKWMLDKDSPQLLDKEFRSTDVGPVYDVGNGLLIPTAEEMRYDAERDLLIITPNTNLDPLGLGPHELTRDEYTTRCLSQALKKASDKIASTVQNLVDLGHNDQASNFLHRTLNDIYGFKATAPSWLSSQPMQDLFAFESRCRDLLGIYFSEQTVKHSMPILKSTIAGESKLRKLHGYLLQIKLISCDASDFTSLFCI